MDLVIKLHLNEGPTTTDIIAAVRELADKIDDQYLEDLIYVAAKEELCGIPVTVIAADEIE
jgi:hypothetical protein